MMTFLLGLLLMTWFDDARPLDTAAEATGKYYAEGNVEALKQLYRETDDRTVRLLCRYRLYPLTQDETYLEDLPTALDAPSARELALLSGLWGYRVREAPVWKTPTYGRRAMDLLDQARMLDAEDPFVVLIDGQSYLFRPALFGGDLREALRCFRKLERLLAEDKVAGLSVLEASLWEWYTLEKMGTDVAEQVRQQLLDRDLPVMYRQFLMDPP